MNNRIEKVTLFYCTNLRQHLTDNSSGALHTLSDDAVRLLPPRLWIFFGWLIWVLRFLRHFFQSLGSRFPQRGGNERTDRRENNVQTSSTRTYCKHSRPLPYAVMELPIMLFSTLAEYYFDDVIQTSIYPDLLW